MVADTRKTFPAGKAFGVAGMFKLFSRALFVVFSDIYGPSDRSRMTTDQPEHYLLSHLGTNPHPCALHQTIHS